MIGLILGSLLYGMHDNHNRFCDSKSGSDDYKMLYLIKSYSRRSAAYRYRFQILY